MPADVRKNKSQKKLNVLYSCQVSADGKTLFHWAFFFLYHKNIFSPRPYKSYKYRIALFILISSFHSHAICWHRAPLAGSVIDFIGAYFCTVAGNGVDVSRALGEKSLKPFKGSCSASQNISNFLVRIYILSIVQLLGPQKMLSIFLFHQNITQTFFLHKFIRNAFSPLPW